MIIIIDNTQKEKVKMYLPNLVKYFDDRNIPYTLIDGDIHGLPILKKLLSNKSVRIHGIVLTGSPIMPYTHLNIDDYVANIHCLKYASHIPTLGICFGCQIMNVYFGGSLYDMNEVFCKKMKVHHAIGAPSFWKSIDGMAQFCCRYLPNIVSPQFDVMMNVMKTFPCVIKHKDKNLIGVMFHPEAMKKTHKVLDYFIQTLS
jgi:anthranilate/para-aminobenzoate synthase component II